MLQTLYKTQVRELREEVDEKSRQIVELEEEHNSLTGQLQLAVGRADSEALARSIAEETVAELEKEKTVKELEIHDLLSRHSSEVAEKESALNAVSVKMLGLVLFETQPLLCTLPHPNLCVGTLSNVENVPKM